MFDLDGLQRFDLSKPMWKPLCVASTVSQWDWPNYPAKSRFLFQVLADHPQGLTSCSTWMACSALTCRSRCGSRYGSH